jgi:ABC-type transporter Mla subunit MlaD
MASNRSDFRTGLFVLAAVALFVLGLVALGARLRNRNTLRFETAVVGDAEGLAVGSPVKFMGVQIGKVSRIGFAWMLYPDTTNHHVVVEFDLDPELIPPGKLIRPARDRKGTVDSGLRTRLRSHPITGSSALFLEMLKPADFPPPPIDWTPRHPYLPSAPSFFGEILESVSESLREIRHIDFLRIQRQVDEVLTSLAVLVRNVDRFDFESISKSGLARLEAFQSTNLRLQQLIDDVRAIVRDMQLPALSANANSTLTNANVTLANLDALARDLQTASQRAQNVLAELESLKLDPLNDTLDHARRAAATLDDTLRGIREYPAGALFGRPPSPARSVTPH